MSFTALVCWGLVVFGGNEIATHSKFFAPMRQAVKKRSAFFGQLVACQFCFGVWVGLAFSLLGGVSPSGLVCSHWPLWARALADGSAAAPVCLAGHFLLVRLAAEPVEELPAGELVGSYPVESDNQGCKDCSGALARGEPYEAGELGEEPPPASERRDKGDWPS